MFDMVMEGQGIGYSLISNSGWNRVAHGSKHRPSRGGGTLPLRATSLYISEKYSHQHDTIDIWARNQSRECNENCLCKAAMILLSPKLLPVRCQSMEKTPKHAD